MKLEKYIEASEHLKKFYDIVWSIDPYPNMNGKRALPNQKRMAKNLSKVKDALDIIKSELENTMCWDADVKPEDFNQLVDDNGMPFPAAITHIFYGFAGERPRLKTQSAQTKLAGEDILV